MRALEIRAIRAEDKPHLSQGMERVSAHTLYLRFHTPKPALSAAELKYFTEVDQHNHIALVATPPDHPDYLLAVARCIRLPQRPWQAEIAVIVADECHRQGVGRRMVAELCLRAYREGIRELIGVIQPENRAIQALMRSFGGQWRQSKLGEREMVIPLSDQLIAQLAGREVGVWAGARS